MATVVRAFTAASSPVVATSVSTTEVCEIDWISDVLPAANGPVTSSLKTCSPASGSVIAAALLPVALAPDRRARVCFVQICIGDS